MQTTLMRFLFGLILIDILILQCCHQTNDSSQIDNSKSPQMLLTTSSTFENCENIKISGIDFSVVLREEGDTSYWYTTDSRFTTSEGFKVGSSWNKIPETLKIGLNKMPGWGYYIPLNSGWNIAFCEGKTCTDQQPSDSSTIDWIFKRR